MHSRETSPFQDATEELLTHILPIVLERMRIASRRLEDCARRLRRPHASHLSGTTEPRGGRGVSELETVQEDSERLGWIMGVLASASGEDLILARREPYGLAVMVDLISEVLAIEGRALEPDASELPDLAPLLTDGWRLPWAFGLLFRLAARNLGPEAPVRWTLQRQAEGVQLLFPGADPEGTAPLLVELEGLLRGAEARILPEGFGMAFPAGWFALAAD